MTLAGMQGPAFPPYRAHIHVTPTVLTTKSVLGKPPVRRGHCAGTTSACFRNATGAGHDLAQ